MSDSKELMNLLNSKKFKNLLQSRNIQCQFPVLTPNVKGIQHAIQLGAKEVAIFGAASESFSQKNINCSIAESLKRFENVMLEAEKNHLMVRG